MRRPARRPAASSSRSSSRATPCRKILLGSGVATADVEAIAEILTRLGVADLKTGQLLRIAFRLEESGEDARRRPSRLTIYAKNAHVATVAMTDTGRFVLGEEPPGPVPVVQDAQVAAPDDRLPSIYESLYQTAVDTRFPARWRQPARHLLARRRLQRRRCVPATA